MSARLPNWKSPRYAEAVLQEQAERVLPDVRGAIPERNPEVVADPGLKRRQAAELEITDDGDEFILEIGDLDGLVRPDEGPGFEEIRGADAVLEQQPLRGDLNPAGGSELSRQRGIALRHMLDRGGGVVHQIAAHPRQMDPDRKGELLQRIAIPDAREHQKLGRVQRPRGDHQFAPHLEAERAALGPALQAHRPLVGELDPGDAGIRQHSEI